MVALASPAPSLAAEPVTAEQAMQNYHERFSAAEDAAACPKGDDPDTITVCGRRTSSPRLPLPVEPEPGEHTRLIAGEVPSGAAALNEGGCLRLCPGSVGVDLRMMGDIVKGIGRILKGDD